MWWNPGDCLGRVWDHATSWNLCASLCPPLTDLQSHQVRWWSWSWVIGWHCLGLGHAIRVSLIQGGCLLENSGWFAYGLKIYYYRTLGRWSVCTYCTYISLFPQKLRSIYICFLYIRGGEPVALQMFLEYSSHCPLTIGHTSRAWWELEASEPVSPSLF